MTTLAGINIQHKIITGAGVEPTVSDIEIGEYAINTTDNIWFFRSGAEIIRIHPPIKRLSALTDGSSISVDCENYQQVSAPLSTAESTIALTLSNVNFIFDLSVKKTIAGDCVITIDGTDLKFIDMDNKTTPATSVDITLSDTVNFYFEISCKDSGITDGGDKVILVKSI